MHALPTPPLRQNEDFVLFRPHGPRTPPVDSVSISFYCSHHQNSHNSPRKILVSSVLLDEEIPKQQALVSIRSALYAQSTPSLRSHSALSLCSLSTPAPSSRVKKKKKIQKYNIRRGLYPLPSPRHTPPRAPVGRPCDTLQGRTGGRYQRRHGPRWRHVRHGKMGCLTRHRLFPRL
jgi:hypothetical protein